LSSVHIIGSVEGYKAYKHSNETARRVTVSWRDYIVHVLIVVLVFEIIILVEIYHYTKIEGIPLTIIIGFVAIALTLIIVRFFINLVVNNKFDVLDDEVLRYILNNGHRK
jgi:membrane protein YdbS with pleckstrin-like domain